MISNVGEIPAGVPVGDHEPEAEIAAYDRLPPELREIIQIAPARMSVQPIEDLWIRTGYNTPWTIQLVVAELRRLFPRWNRV